LFSSSENAVLIHGVTSQELISAIKQAISDMMSAKDDQDVKSWYSVQELADELNVSRQTIRNWISSGKLKAQKVGRIIRIEDTNFQSAMSEMKSLKYKRG
jgi:excisionase family DNA binding protein